MPSLVDVPRKMVDERLHLAEDPAWLYLQMEVQNSKLLLIDVRPFPEYCQAHIEGAINLAVPSLMLRRLKKGNMRLSSLITSDAAKEKFESRSEVERIVIYDYDTMREENEVINVLLNKLSEDNRVCFLQGGFKRFEESYPHLCQCGEGNEVGKTMFSLAALTITDTNNNCEKPNLSSTTFRKEFPGLFRPDSAGPIEIVPHLYLGNKRDSADLNQLEKLTITHILNVTHDLPNEFEEMQKFKYLKLHVQDNWDGNLLDLFPQAFSFIDKAREDQNSVLVHCVGGISRSSTIIIGYLMLKFGYTLNDAYDFVKQKKSNIAPNFNFMGQLLDFERSQSNPQTPCCESSAPSSCTSSPYLVDSDSVSASNVSFVSGSSDDSR